MALLLQFLVDINKCSFVHYSVNISILMWNQYTVHQYTAHPAFLFETLLRDLYGLEQIPWYIVSNGTFIFRLFFRLFLHFGLNFTVNCVGQTSFGHSVKSKPSFLTF